MTVYVTIELFQGILHEVHVYRIPGIADRAEQAWLEEYGITDQDQREALAANGTEFHITTCALI